MELKEAIYTRRSVREFTTEPVEERTIRGLIDAAIQAPSAVNEQPWSFCVVRDRGLLTRISENAKAYMLKSSPQQFRDQLSDPHFDIFYHAPALIVISSVVECAWAAEDCTLAAANMMLAAREAGLGTCWIGFAQRWLETAEGKAVISLPETHKPVAAIIVGHPKSEPQPVPRKEPTISWIG